MVELTGMEQIRRAVPSTGGGRGDERAPAERTRRGALRMLAGIAGLTGPLGAACGAFGRFGGEGGPPSEARHVAITFHHQWPATASHGPVIDRMVARFNQQFPSITVTTVFGGTEPGYQEKLTGIVAAGDTPDVFTSNYDSTPSWVKRQVVVSPESLDRGSTRLHKNDLVPTARNAVTYDGKVMAMPYILTPAALAYIQTMFRQNGLDPNKPPTTWDELVDMGKRVTGGSGETETWGWQLPIGVGAGAVNHWLAFLWQNGGDTVDYNKRVPIWNSAAGVEALQFWVDMVHKHRIAALNQPANSFMLGRSAMWHMYPGGVGTAKNRIGNQFDWATAMLPKKKQQACILGGHALLVGKTNKNHEQAWQFVHWFTAPNNIFEFSVAVGTLPPWKSAEQHPTWRQYLRDEPRMKAFVGMVPLGRPPERLSTWGQCQALLGQAKDDALTLKVSARQALDDAARAAEPLIKSG